MWDVLVRTPLGTQSRRKFSHVLATFIVAVFGYIFLTSPTAAAVDANWDGDTLSYDGRTYAQVDSDDAFPADVKASPAIYQSVDGTQTPNLVHFVFFAPGTTDARSENEATYVRYTLNPPNRYINPTPANGQTITVIPGGEVVDNDDGTFSNECMVDGIGWVVCPVMNGVAEGMDLVYGLISNFLEVQPITTSINNPIYRIWTYSRDLANIAFVIGFMVIIYSYLVGGGFNAYEIRKILPRLVIAAILINVSYLICAVAVDISNIAGYGVNQLFETVRDDVLSGASSAGSDIDWKNVTAWVLAGGTGAVVGGIALTTAVGGAAGGLWFLLAPFLLGAALLVMVTFLILAARQALIVILIAVAPLAFAAFILPNTEKWFERWRGIFFTMLIMFPAFGAVFGGAQLAGEVIIRSASSIEMVILGLGVMVAPLAITPLLLKLGGGLLNRIGGIINNPQKGLYDRYKNYNRDRLGEHVARNNAKNAELRRTDGFGRRNILRRTAARNYAKQNYREGMKKLDEEKAQNEWDAQHGRYGGDNHQGRDSVRSRITGRPVSGYGNLDEYKRRNSTFHDNHHAHHDEHWQEILRSDSALRGMVTDTAMTKGRADVMSGAIEAQDERSFQTALNTDASYANLRSMKVQTSVDAGVADVQKQAVEAAGKLALSNTVSGDRGLRKMKVETYSTEKQSETIDNMLKKNAEANWDYVSRTNADIQELRLSEVKATDQARRTEAEWNTMVENIRAVGSSAPSVAVQSGRIADSIKGLGQDIEIQQRALDAAKVVQSENLAGALKASQDAKTDPSLGDATLLVRAGGIGGDRAQTRIFAKAKSEVVNAAVEEVKTNRTLTSEMTRFQLHELMKHGKMPGSNQKATVEMQQAAMYALLQEKGNNQDANEIRDVISKMGLMVDDNGRYFEAKRDASGRIIPGANGYPEIDLTKEVTDKNEIARRRDWQQFFDDAAGGSPHSMVTYSGTNKSEARSGNMVDDIRGGFLRDATSGKFSPEKILKADIDELKTLLEDLHSPTGYYAGLSGEKKQQVDTTLESAILRLQGNENINAGIDDRNRGAMNDILAKVNPADYAPVMRNGKRIYPVDENKAIIPPAKRTAADKEFAAPVDVPGVHRAGNYYTEWDVDLQL